MFRLASQVFFGFFLSYFHEFPVFVIIGPNVFAGRGRSISDSPTGTERFSFNPGIPMDHHPPSPCKIAILNPIRIGPRPETKSSNFSLVTSGCVTINFVFLISVPPPLSGGKHDTRKRLYCKVIYWIAYTSIHRMQYLTKLSKKTGRTPADPMADKNRWCWRWG